MAASIAYAAASAAAGPAFEGDDAWVGAQLGRKAAKAKHRARRNADPTIIVPFNRDEFTERVKFILDGDVSDGFVIGLKHRREFALQLCEEYKHFTETQKLELVLALAVDLGIQDLSLMVKTLPSIPRSNLVLNVMAAALGFSRKNDPQISKNIKRGLVPLTEQFFLIVGSIPPGPKFLLQLRVDLERLLKRHEKQLPRESVQALEFLDMVMRDLFATQAGMRFRRIDMTSEKLVSFVLRNERVHAFRNWADLQRRISGRNRFCFGLFHSNMPNAPLVFVEVLVTDHLSNRIDPILDHDTVLKGKPSHIIFYAISNSNGGLRGLNIASHLLFLTIERMSSQFPECHTSATLSPVPGFGTWIRKVLSSDPTISRRLFTTEQSQRISMKCGVNQTALAKWVLSKLDSPNWHKDAVFVDTMHDVLTSACARYILFERKGDKILNPVANFHLQNGAQVEQINFLADLTPQMLQNSCSMMINYRYVMTSIDVTSVSYKRNSSAALSPAVARLVLPSLNALVDEIESVKEKRNIPLFARVYQRGEAICTRGKLSTAVYIISSGRVRVHSAHPFTLEEGAMIGGSEILKGEPVPYTVRALETTHMLLLPSSDFLYVKKECSAAAGVEIKSYGVR
uniref:Cyclic nucleotide-binding domain-containing protein n=1 Tax=Globisporangium ultimum (strain ATCC 200006 / CBS 805.95 / DAOM BR144) TaxID=431595 RepID=K3WUN5_GLOUD